MALKIETRKAGNWQAASIILYGAPGSGKTTTAAAAPKPLILDCEMGCGAVSGAMVAIDSLATMHEVLAYLEAGKGQSYSTIVLDGLDTFYHMVRDQLLGSSKAQTRDRRSTHIEPTEEISRVMRRLQRLSFLKVYTAHSKETTSESRVDNRTVQKKSIELALPPAICDVAYGAVDIVLYSYITPKDQRRRFYASSVTHDTYNTSTTVFAKDRSGRFGDRPLDLSWVVIDRTLGLSGATQPAQPTVTETNDEDQLDEAA